MQTTDQLLEERGRQHGDFTMQARVTQEIKRALQASPSWSGLPPYMRETLEMIAHKMGRIVCGNPEHHDHWADIAGYARLVETRIDRRE